MTDIPTPRRLRSRDWFGVSVCALFLASSLGDLSWYIADARTQQLDLVSFSPDGGTWVGDVIANDLGVANTGIWTGTIQGNDGQSTNENGGAWTGGAGPSFPSFPPGCCAITTGSSSATSMRW